MFQILIEGLNFPESPFWSQKDGCLYFCEWLGNRVWRWSKGRAEVIFELLGGPSGLAQDAAGNFWACLYDARCLACLDSQGEILFQIDSWQGQPFRGVCDLAIGPHNGIYFSDSGDFNNDWQSGQAGGAIYVYHPDKGLQRLNERLRFPNGLIFSPDGDRLYVNEHRANRVLVYDVTPGGLLVGHRVLYELDQDCLLAKEHCFELGPDGLCVAADGELWLAHYGGGKLVNISPDGADLGVLRLPRGNKPTNVAWHDQERALYITEAELGLLYLYQLAPN